MISQDRNTLIKIIHALLHNPLLDQGQINQISIGLEEGLDVSQYDELDNTPSMMRGYMERLRNHIDISILKDQEYTYHQMFVIIKGLVKGVNISKYSKL